ncbi:unnamed protein product, partial [Onchocerca ochengi]|uniref:WH2 domain-containing protein n=1 Tax=Onchocerca ochengi TaxID=42157 RepID=A0A182EUE6_ONCOC
MVDRELAIKLAKRFNKLNFDTSDSVDESQNSSISKPPPPPPPPLPPQKEPTPPFRIKSDNEWIDMDQLIGQTLHSLQVNSIKTPNNTVSSMDYTPEPFKKPLSSINNGDSPIQVKAIDYSDNNQGNDSSPLSSKCTAPIVPIIHHKNNNHEQLKKFDFNDSILQK